MSQQEPQRVVRTRARFARDITPGEWKRVQWADRSEPDDGGD